MPILAFSQTVLSARDAKFIACFQNIIKPRNEGFFGRIIPAIAIKECQNKRVLNDFLIAFIQDRFLWIVMTSISLCRPNQEGKGGSIMPPINGKKVGKNRKTTDHTTSEHENINESSSPEGMNTSLCAVDMQQSCRYTAIAVWKY